MPHRRFCSFCDVFWSPIIGDSCWMCSRNHQKPSTPKLTDEEIADAKLAALIAMDFNKKTAT